MRWPASCLWYRCRRSSRDGGSLRVDQVDVRLSMTAERESGDLDTIFNLPPGRGLDGIKMHVPESTACLYPRRESYISLLANEPPCAAPRRIILLPPRCYATEHLVSLYPFLLFFFRFQFCRPISQLLLSYEVPLPNDPRRDLSRKGYRRSFPGVTRNAKSKG